MNTVFLNEICSIKNVNEKREVCGSQSEENCIEIAKGDIDNCKSEEEWRRSVPFRSSYSQRQCSFCPELSTNERKD